MKAKRIVVHIQELIEKEDISLRELGRQADIQISALSPLANGKKQRVDLGHLKRIAEALDINDMNEIISIVDEEGIRYTNPNLVAYVGEYVLIRYNPADLVEIRIYYENKYLCNGISPELSNYSVDLNELVSARNKRQRTLQEKVQSPSAVDLLIGEKKKELQKNPKQKKSKLKRYYNE